LGHALGGYSGSPVLSSFSLSLLLPGSTIHSCHDVLPHPSNKANWSSNLQNLSQNNLFLFKMDYLGSLLSDRRLTYTITCIILTLLLASLTNMYLISTSWILVFILIIYSLIFRFSVSLGV
jgi:hypothetical protein